MPAPLLLYLMLCDWLLVCEVAGHVAAVLRWAKYLTAAQV